MLQWLFGLSASQQTLRPPYESCLGGRWALEAGIKCSQRRRREGAPGAPERGGALLLPCPSSCCCYYCSLPLLSLCSWLLLPTCFQLVVLRTCSCSYLTWLLPCFSPSSPTQLSLSSSYPSSSDFSFLHRRPFFLLALSPFPPQPLFLASPTIRQARFVPPTPTTSLPCALVPRATSTSGFSNSAP